MKNEVNELAKNNCCIPFVLFSAPTKYFSLVTLINSIEQEKMRNNFSIPSVGDAVVSNQQQKGMCWAAGSFMTVNKIPQPETQNVGGRRNSCVLCRKIFILYIFNCRQSIT